MPRKQLSHRRKGERAATPPRPTLPDEELEFEGNIPTAPDYWPIMRRQDGSIIERPKESDG